LCGVLAKLSLCAGFCLLVCGGLAFSPSEARADEGLGVDVVAIGASCPCSRCVNVCGGAPPCVGSCNNPDAGCVGQSATCNCSCRSGGGTNPVCGCY